MNHLIALILLRILLRTLVVRCNHHEVYKQIVVKLKSNLNLNRRQYQNNHQQKSYQKVLFLRLFRHLLLLEKLQHHQHLQFPNKQDMQEEYT